MGRILSVIQWDLLRWNADEHRRTFSRIRKLHCAGARHLPDNSHIGCARRSPGKRSKDAGSIPATSTSRSWCSPWRAPMGLFISSARRSAPPGGC